MALDAAQNVFKLHFPAYQAILDGDYLQHTVLYDALDQELLQLPVLQNKSLLSLLDLGCGDAVPLCKALAVNERHRLLHSYTGVDMSSPALALAENNTKTILSSSCKTNFHESDMLSFLRSPHCQSSYDVVLASFSIHHLQPHEKLELYRVLHPQNGTLIMIDVLRFPDESVAGYRKRICDDARDNWVLMPPVERATFIRHMQNYDFPETLEAFREMASQAGFASVEIKCAASKALGNLVIFQS